jgi:NTP pyrophosphatase (non-canonical NTP hydrolase)
MRAHRWIGRVSHHDRCVLAAATVDSAILLRDYAGQVAPTDKLPLHDLKPVLYGLFGEVGSIMTTAKKNYRESEAYKGYRAALEEEFGDTIWYLAALCRRVEISIDEAFEGMFQDGHIAIAATDLNIGPIASVALTSVNPDLGAVLLRLGEAAADLLSLESDRSSAISKIGVFAGLYVEALQAAKLSFARVLLLNIEKVRGRFLQATTQSLPTFDRGFPKDEQIPDRFEIHIVERANGKCYLRWNGVFLGDPLTDNIGDRDGYRFHDVFHFSHAAVLHWSPVFRALIKHKRKSNPDVDESQDGGRAIVAEEGLTAWVFARAKMQNFFEDQDSLSFDLLKTLQQFVAGYEVAQCPLQLWENSILQGYKVFRHIQKAQRGIVIGDRGKRSLTFKPLT